MTEMRVLVVGHSHVKALMTGWELLSDRFPAVSMRFIGLADERFRKSDAQGRLLSPIKPGDVRFDLVLAEFDAAVRQADVAVFCLNGNEHKNLGMFKRPSPSGLDVDELVRKAARENYDAWIARLAPRFTVPALFVFPPPPLRDESFILSTERVRQLSRVPELRAAEERLRSWRVQCEEIASVAADLGADALALPEDVFSDDGFLSRDCYRDISHGNHVYGQRVVTALIDRVLRAQHAAPPPVSAPADAGKHPYSDLPDYMFWRRSVSNVAAGQIDPVIDPPFKIGAQDKVATAGSCFAQHISKRLRAGGFQFLVTEAASTSEQGGETFHDFSARYGNVYTARQLVQLFDRAFGFFTPLVQAWRMENGRCCDPFRPTIEPEGYEAEAAVLDAARGHLQAVQRMFRELDVFVFTLGLTECWISRLDGAAYPLAPGVAGGTYDPRDHQFVNFGVTEVVRDLECFLDKLRVVNPEARVILTVSPVPLAATHVTGRHVLVSTFHSKAVLRVAAHDVCSRHSGVYYFPSFEIIMNGQGDRSYFAADRRTVRDEGVDHVMRVFMSRLTDSGQAGSPGAAQDGDRHWQAEVEAMNQALCDEEILDRPAG